MGRRKIHMKMVNDSNARQVTFSKRRSGLFKKANELSTLCGAELAIVVFSPGGKPFSFGHPSVDLVMQRFLNQEAKPIADVVDHYIFDPQQEAKLGRLNQHFHDLLNKLQEEKKKGVMLDKALKANVELKWNKPINELSLDELEKMKEPFEELRDKVRGRVTEMDASSSLMLLSERDLKDANN